MKTHCTTHLDSLRLGRLALLCAGGSLFALLSTVPFPATEPVIVFAALAAVALFAGWLSRRTQAARFALLLAALTLFVAAPLVGTWHQHNADTFGGANVEDDLGNVVPGGIAQ